MASEHIRVVVAKPGLDGHDRGAKVVARILRDQGFEVIYSGLHQTTESIALLARDEDVSIVGISILSGAHVAHTRDLRQHLNELGLTDVRIVVGGVIPAADEAALREAGADDIFVAGDNVLEIGQRLKALVASRELR